ncbi:hypothetical protein [Spirillospora sp. NBC_01491]|uniref:hypothetical protein n=1 Tax=Spirillospora sp. NBC_01491 TaxID=2976007 RepID=UPI002E32456C|nr:hypothetical protein [Spirillospora sp. NBC_01491]
MASDEGLAVEAVNEALADAPPDTSARIRRVQVGEVSGNYVTLAVVGVARRDAETGAVEWTDGGPW